jgi:hypothetical protein
MHEIKRINKANKNEINSENKKYEKRIYKMSEGQSLWISIVWLRRVVELRCGISCVMLYYVLSRYICCIMKESFKAVIALHATSNIEIANVRTVLTPHSWSTNVFIFSPEGAELGPHSRIC